LDKNQEEIYNGVRPHVRKHLDESLLYSDQLSTIFEGIQLEFESQREQEMRRHDPENQTSDPFRVRTERTTGLNAKQLKELLKEGYGEPDEEHWERGISLAMDFLIDTGVQVPMFYYREDIGQFQRVYRHGEGALNRMTYNYVADSVIEALFEYAETETLRKVTVEKIGVMITDCLNDGRYWDQSASAIYDFLTASGRSTNLEVNPEYHRYGKIVLLKDTVDNVEGNFVAWCLMKGILEERPDGVARSTEWQSQDWSAVDEEAEVRATVSDQELRKLESIAQLLYDVDRNVDDKRDNILTAITTCRDHCSYVQAIKQEIDLFFEGDQWCIDPAIQEADKLIVACSDYNDDEFNQPMLTADATESIGSALDLSAKPKSAISAVRHKQALRKKVEEGDIIERIDSFFDGKRNTHYKHVYEQNLQPYLLNLTDINPYASPPAQRFIKKTETFGEVCIRFVRAFRALLRTLNSIAHDSDNLRKHVHEMYDAVGEFNAKIEADGTVMYSSSYLDEVTTLSLDEIRLSPISEQRYDETLATDRAAFVLVQDLLGQTVTAYRDLRQIYQTSFAGTWWEQRLSDLFTKQTSPETIEANWVVWYDIRDSSAPENAAQTDDLTSNLDDRLEELSALLEDGQLRRSNDDEKHVFVAERRNVLKYLHRILEETEVKNMHVRMGVCRVPKGEITIDEYGVLESNDAHVRSVRIGDYLSKAEECSEPAGCHPLAVSENALDRLFDSDTLPRKLRKKWRVIDRQEHEADLKDPVEFVPFTVFFLDNRD
jgi:hypothetical protein